LTHNQSKRSRIGKLPEFEDEQVRFGNENLNQFNMGPGVIEEKRDLNKKQSVNLGGLGKEGKGYMSG
jgi:hypothetical protein